MKFREALIPKSKVALRDAMSDAMLRSPKRQFPDWEDFDGVFHSLMAGTENLRGRFAEGITQQLLEMIATAKMHYEAGDNKLGGALLEDAKMVVMGRQPWAYPQDRYRWRKDESLPTLSEADLLSKEIEGEG